MSDLKAVIAEAEERGWMHTLPPDGVVVHYFQRGDVRFGFTSKMAAGPFAADAIRRELAYQEAMAVRSDA